MTGTHTQHPINSGDVPNIDNRANRAQQEKAKIAAGTEVVAVLAPGASLSITAGQEALDIRIEDSDETCTGPTPVR